MAKHQVIRDVGQTLLGVLRAELSSQRSKAKAYLAAPTTDFLRKNAPCLVLYLYDIRPSVDVRTNENWHLEGEITDAKGETHVVRYAPPLEMGLHYLISAAEVTPWMEGKFVRPVVIEKRNQRNLPREAASLVRSPTTERKE